MSVECTLIGEHEHATTSDSAIFDPHTGLIELIGKGISIKGLGRLIREYIRFSGSGLRGMGVCESCHRGTLKAEGITTHDENNPFVPGTMTVYFCRICGEEQD